jgi:hypothetical protein
MCNGLKDTQYLYDFCNQLHEGTMNSSHYPKNQISLSNLLKEFGLDHPLKEDFNHELWGNRPFTDEMLLYACYDVAYLPNLCLNIEINIQKAIIERVSRLSSDYLFVSFSPLNPYAKSYLDAAKVKFDIDYFIQEIESNGEIQVKRILEKNFVDVETGEEIILKKFQSYISSPLEGGLKHYLLPSIQECLKKMDNFNGSTIYEIVLLNGIYFFIILNISSLS